MTNMPGPKTKLRIIGIWCVFAVAALELFSRAEDLVRWDAPFFPPYNAKFLQTVDDVGARCKPGARFKRWKVGDDGFRDSSGGLAVAAPAAVAKNKKVVVVGASEAFGLTESLGADFPSQLQTKINDIIGDQVVVKNASCPGLSVARLVPLLENWIQLEAPDTLIIYPTPHFYLDTYMPSESARSPTASLTDHSRLLGHMKERLKQFVPTDLQLLVRKTARRFSLYKQGPDYIWQEVPADRLERFRSDYFAMLSAATRASEDVVVLTHATRFGIGDEQVGDAFHAYAWMSFYPRATLQTLLDMDRAANDIIRDSASLKGVSVVDLDKEISGQREFFADFSHFTDSGSNHVSQLIAVHYKAGQE